MASRSRNLPARPDMFGDVFEPAEAVQPILAKPVREALLEWLTEIWAEKELSEVGIAPRRKAIFDGPPGVGKTTLAHHMAARLGLTMLAVRPERVISKYIGETGENLGRLFDCASDPAEPLLLFLDEFDALSRQRRKGTQAADDSRNEEVNTLLQRLEQHQGFVIAATNFSDHIDQAIWRRFDIHLTLELPGSDERAAIFDRYLRPFRLHAADLQRLAEATETASPALIRKFCEGLKRQFVIGPKLKSDMRREAVIDRLIATIHPHPDAGKPRLWSLGARDAAIRSLPWPLSRDAPAEPVAALPAAETGATIISFGAKS